VTPALLVFHQVLEENIGQMVQIAGDPSRLRPHCKTHKMREVIRLQLAKGVVKHKAATFAEAEMLAEAGAQDVLLAYHPVGPNVARVVKFLEAFPDVTFSVIADHAQPITELGKTVSAAGRTVNVLLDMDTGQHRTGVLPGAMATELYRTLSETAGLQPGGLHFYDGQNHQVDISERRRAVHAAWESIAGFRATLLEQGYPVPRIVAGATGSFPILAAMDDPTMELCPGTCVFHDVGYSKNFPDLPFVPAALLLTRVISRPTPDRVTCDLGYKAVASDAPVDRRVAFPDIPDARIVLQNEEHLVICTSRAEEFQPGDEMLAVPFHVCPTSALQKQVYVVRDGEIVERWDIAARDRQLTI
jgi:D-serine deaminase-like pyridoxal phosphate-dependent protein